MRSSITRLTVDDDDAALPKFIQRAATNFCPAMHCAHQLYNLSLLTPNCKWYMFKWFPLSICMYIRAHNIMYGKWLRDCRRRQNAAVALPNDELSEKSDCKSICGQDYLDESVFYYTVFFYDLKKKQFCYSFVRIKDMF